MAIVDLSKEQDLPGCVNAPVFLQEVIRCSSEDVAKPASTILMIFAEMAQFAARKDNPELNLLMLRLGLFKMPPDQLKTALEAEMERAKKFHIPHAQAKAAAHAEPAAQAKTEQEGEGAKSDTVA